MPLKPIRVLIVSDSVAMRHRIAGSLGFIARVHLVGNVSSGEEALALISSDVAEPDVVLVDCPMLRGRVITIRAVRETLLSAEVIALVSVLEDCLVEEALQAGAIGCLPRNDLTSDLLYKAILFAYNGMKFRLPVPAAPLVPPTIPVPVPATPALPALPVAPPTVPHPLPPGQALTERECEVLRWLVRGLSNGEIADHLIITPATVKFHLRNIRSKLGTTTRTETVVYALLNHLVPDH